MKEDVCDYCGESFKRYSSHMGRGKKGFCSYDCTANYYAEEGKSRINKNCFWCGKEEPIENMEEEYGQHFCSGECVEKFENSKLEKEVLVAS